VKLSSIIMSLFVTMLLVSCGTMQTYEGPKLPPDEVAVVKSNFGNVFNIATVLAIDGIELGSQQINSEILPGVHTVKVRVTTGVGIRNYIGVKTVTLTANKGHTYIVDGVVKEGEPWVWIMDEGTSQTVAGKKYTEAIQTIEEPHESTSHKSVDGIIQAYEGKRLTTEEVATIKPNYGSVLDIAYVDEIDGEKIGTFQVYNDVEILPGEHLVKVSVQTGLGMSQYRGSKTVILYAEAGHTYKLHGQIRKGEPSAWIVDEVSNAIVAGEKPIITQ